MPGLMKKSKARKTIQVNLKVSQVLVRTASINVRRTELMKKDLTLTNLINEPHHPNVILRW